MPGSIIFEELITPSHHRIGLATLTAERSLNALTLNMIRTLDQQLSDWEDNPELVCVVLRGHGDKAFCAGGDVRSLRDALLADPLNTYPNSYATTFFSEEYTLDYHIHTYSKPLITWGNGIIMGGGLGLMAGASHRIVTPHSRIAMPEITIGLYPDVAGSWFLQRMPAKLGLFLGLTGAPLNAHDAIIANLADYIVPADSFALLMTKLLDTRWDDNRVMHYANISALLNSIKPENPNDLPPSRVHPHLCTIHKLMNHGQLVAIAHALTDTTFEDPWLAQAATTFTAGSPTSAAITWEMYRRARHLSLADVLRLELVVSINMCAKPDFREGVRARLIDKDHTPSWHYKTIDAISEAWVNQHFDSPWPTTSHPLAMLS